MTDLQNRGWVRLHRQIENNCLWFLEPFTKAQAWIDLFLNANHKDNSFSVRGNIVNIKRGQIGWSELTMTSRWKWSKNKVRRFLKLLETEQQIIQQKSTITTIITILKYDKFQTDDTADDTAERQQKDSRKTADDTQTRMIKNVKNVKNDNSKNGLAPAKRTEQSYVKEDYDTILEEYQKLKGIKLQGAEFLPYQQAIKTMFMSGRTKDNIIACMQWLAKGDDEWMENWTLKTAKMKLPEFLAGNFKSNKLTIIT